MHEEIFVLSANQGHGLESKVQYKDQIECQKQSDTCDHYKTYRKFGFLLQYKICEKEHVNRNRLDQQFISEFDLIQKLFLFWHKLAKIYRDQDIQHEHALDLDAGIFVFRCIGFKVEGYSAEHDSS